MATKKDLVEAYSFNRRRLVTAFLSGAPGGREVEPNRPGRTIAGGIALAVLVAAGAAVGGVLSDHTSVDWSRPALISEKESGALYVNLPADGSSTSRALRPVVNVTSAMLLLGPDLTPTSVPRDDISGRDPGDQIGILQAPTTPPPPAALIQSGWTACTGATASDPEGIEVTVSRSHAVTPAPDAGVLVRADGQVYLVAESGDPGGAYALPVPSDGAKDNFLGKLTGTLYADATPVPQDWLDLFPLGSPLSGPSFDVRRLGRPGLTAVPARGRRHLPRNGDFFRVAGDPELRVLTGGTFTELDPFASLIYPYVRFRGGFEPRELASQLLDPEVANQAASITDRSHWPAAVTGPQAPGDDCAVLDTADATHPAVDLATAAPGARAAATDVDAGRRQAVVDSGAGALVWSAALSAASAARLLFLIDDQGLAHQLDPVRSSAATDGADARTQLGYADIADVLVPDAWLELFDAGVPLSVDLARCPPTYGRVSGSESPSCKG